MPGYSRTRSGAGTETNMAQRPIFIPDPNSSCLVREESVKFQWYPGFSIEQKRRSIQALHEAAQRSLPNLNILEVSTKSDGLADADGNVLGQQLSAFRLQKRLPDGSSSSLEAAFQGSKVFEDGQQLSELYSNRSPSNIKRIMGPYQKIPLKCFRFGTDVWELEPKTAFYDWLYIRALFEHKHAEETQRRLSQFNAFTDIEFNPKRSLNCQARSCALFVALAERRELNQTETQSDFLDLIKRYGYGRDETDPGLFGYA